MPTDNERDVEDTYSVSGFVKKLRDLADALESGEEFSVEVAGEEVAIPLAEATFSIEHEREDGAEEIEFQIKWGEKAQNGEDEDEDEEEKAAQPAE